jgi:antitoxin (DNA-binding transcriptional repressor) of toxin-antitoxin stability system
MKKASVHDLHTRTSELVRDAAAIERRGEPVAEVRPVSKKTKAKLPRMTKLWAKLPQLSGDSTDSVSADRDRCI